MKIFKKLKNWWNDPRWDDPSELAPDVAPKNDTRPEKQSSNPYIDLKTEYVNRITDYFLNPPKRTNEDCVTLSSLLCDFADKWIDLKIDSGWIFPKRYVDALINEAKEQSTKIEALREELNMAKESNAEMLSDLICVSDNLLRGKLVAQELMFGLSQIMRKYCIQEDNKDD